ILIFIIIIILIFIIIFIFIIIIIIIFINYCFCRLYKKLWALFLLGLNCGICCSHCVFQIE
ncbi:MAG: hypothetical protein ACKPKO_63745, partial [Candidatus Fonsibacter sp.]